MFALDTETTGVDLRHGASPFFVTLCEDNNKLTGYEWEVDPLTRQVQYDADEVKQLKDRVNSVRQSGEWIVGHNIKFDITALSSVPGWDLEWPWERTHDTLIASHILQSNGKHDLTSLATQYLKLSVQKYEDELEKVVQHCRRRCRTHHKDWMIAKEGLPCMPSARAGQKKSKAGDKDRVWKYDCWLPRAYAKKYSLPALHPYYSVLATYAHSDSSTTLALWRVLEKLLKQQGFWEIYLHQMKLPRIIQAMEGVGVPLAGEQLNKLDKDYREESERLGRVCVNLAAGMGYKITIPKAGVNESLKEFITKGLKLIPDKLTKKNNPCFDKHVLDHWAKALPHRSKELLFIKSLIGKRAMDTALTFIKAYKRFRKPTDQPGWYHLHSSVNITGTDTLRFSQQNPNLQQVSKLSAANLRSMICPFPGEEMWSIDAQNIELRIPAYKAEEKDLIAVFDRPKDPPYFGSYHLAVFDVLYPQLFREYGAECKTLFEASYYQWVKNGNFACIYGCQKKKADETYHLEGAYDLIRYRFPKIAALNDKQIKVANEKGYIETIPNRLVNPNKGYPLWCSRTNWGGVKPTVPLNYYVQGSACDWMRSAMIKVADYLADKPSHKLILNVHDELVFRFPKGKGEQPHLTNLPIIREIQKRMESCGDDIGVPIPCTIEYHPDTWAVGIKI